MVFFGICQHVYDDIFVTTCDLECACRNNPQPPENCMINNVFNKFLSPKSKLECYQKSEPAIDFGLIKKISFVLLALISVIAVILISKRRHELWNLSVAHGALKQADFSNCFF